MTSDPADSLPSPAVRLITVSATYCAGGNVVAPALAQRLGLPFLQRVTTTEGEAALAAPCHERLVAGEGEDHAVHRLLASFTYSMPVGPTQSPLSARHQDEDLRRSAEAGIHGLLADGGVILGRAAAVVLGRDRGFHVRLDGPPRPPIIQGATVEGISQERPALACRRPTRRAPPTFGACTASTRPTHRFTTWLSTPLRSPRHGHRAHPHRGPEPSQRIDIRIEHTVTWISNSWNGARGSGRSG